jgi:methylated-DNA-protein-cysteine methyltransferase-like protein
LKENNFEAIYEVVRLIPKGRVTSYGAIARYLGSKRGARLVGWALNSSFNNSEIPAHRVVNRSGVLTGKAHFSELNEMQNRLESEGIIVENNKIVNFGICFWDPSNELL